jgi:hypothetical protein
MKLSTANNFLGCEKIAGKDLQRALDSKASYGKETV